MNPEITYGIAIAALGLTVILLAAKYNMLQDVDEHNVRLKTFSWSRVQLAWWTVIVLSSFIAIVITYNKAPILSSSTVVLLGISAATTVTAKVIDAAPPSALVPPLSPPTPPLPHVNLVIDILSDSNGVSIPRFQTVVFNLIFGLWFVAAVFDGLHTNPDDDINSIMPVIATTNLVLLGLSSATYAALKTKES